MFCLIKPGLKVLFIAIGGGGDIASAAVLARSMKTYGVNYVLASIAWERYIYDPVPGPIRLNEIENILDRGDSYVVVDGESFAIRGGQRVSFQAAKVAKLLNERIYIIDIYRGVNGYLMAIEDISTREGVDVVIGVDVGGDSIASGCEEELWSPLADWIGLAALARAHGILALHSPGSDGELPQDYILNRIDIFAARGGLLGVRSLCSHDIELLENILRKVSSEASFIPILAHRGMRGEIELRKGSRKVKLSMFNTFTFYLDATTLARNIEPVKAIYNTNSLEEANRILNNYGIYTELDLEEDLARQGVKPEELSSDVLIEIRWKGITRLRSNHPNYCYTKHTNQ